MEAVHLVPDQCANFASHFSSVKIFQIDVFNFASHFIRVQIFQIYFSLKNEKFLFPPSHYNFCIVQWDDKEIVLKQWLGYTFVPLSQHYSWNWKLIVCHTLFYQWMRKVQLPPYHEYLVNAGSVSAGKSTCDRTHIIYIMIIP